MRVSDGDDQHMLMERPLLAYLPPGRWAEVRETRNFPFPAEFKR
jgi:hypothetical protein